MSNEAQAKPAKLGRLIQGPWAGGPSVHVTRQEFEQVQSNLYLVAQRLIQLESIVAELLPRNPIGGHSSDADTQHLYAGQYSPIQPQTPAVSYDAELTCPKPTV